MRAAVTSSPQQQIQTSDKPRIIQFSFLPKSWDLWFQDCGRRLSSTLFSWAVVLDVMDDENLVMGRFCGDDKTMTFTRTRHQSHVFGDAKF